MDQEDKQELNAEKTEQQTTEVQTPSSSSNPLIIEQSTSSNILSIVPSEGQNAKEEKDFEEIHTIQKIEPFQFQIFLAILYYTCCILSLGIIPLIVRWYPHWYIRFTHLKTTKFADATSVLVTASGTGMKTVCKLERVQFANSPQTVVLFRYRHVNFLLDIENQKFQKIKYDLDGSTFYQVHQQPLSGNASTNSMKQIFFGKNSVEVPLKGIFYLFVDEILHPFYLFQIFSVITWAADNYYIYASVIALLATSSLLTSLIDTRRNQLKLHEMAKFSCQVKRIVNRQQSDSNFEIIDSEQLIPGDLIEIECQQNSFQLPCDCILLRGQCIVNEAMLTGDIVYSYRQKCIAFG